MRVPFELTVTRVIPAAREAVFEAWLDPKTLERIMIPEEGMSCSKAEVDGREGGEYRIVMIQGDGVAIDHDGVYKTLQRFEQLVFTWNSEWSVAGSAVTLDFEELGPKQTRLTLHHVEFPNQETCDGYQGGWTRILGLLEAELG